MASLFDLGLGEFDEFKRIAHKAGFSAELIRKVNGDPELAVVARAAIEAKLAEMAKPRFVLSVYEQFRRFSAANKAQGWGFDAEVFERLAATVPEWPEGKL